MIYIISLLGYGDNLITGSILESKDAESAGLRVVGSAITQKVWRLLRRPIQPNVILYDESPGFYTLKESGLVAAIHDANSFRAWARKSLSRNDSIIFEKSAHLRHQWLLQGVGCARIEVHRSMNAYTDRSDVLSNYIGTHTWNLAVRPCGAATSIFINPSARSMDRTLSPQIVETIVAVANDENIKVTLVDTHNNLWKYKEKVHRYILNPSLDEAVSALQHVDRYIGPDSFFMHLAYYLRIPQLALFWKNDVYFQPPGLLNQSGIYYFDDLSNIVHFKRKLQTFIIGDVGVKSAI